MSLARNYSLSSIQDTEHVNNGRCPSYALTWEDKHHQSHWPKGHDYFMGNGNNIEDGSQHLREILSKRLKNGTLTKHIIFCDLDGVLADFEQGVKTRFKKTPDEIDPKLLWGVINKSNSFFEMLPWMPKGKELWSQIKDYHPIILTGVPGGSKTGAEQKVRWCQKELGPDVEVITCKTTDKPKYCLPESILIDDSAVNLYAWQNKGGKFLLYDEDLLDPIVERINKHMGDGLNSP
jgi:hypothetical protein